jgi:protein TonB
MKTAHVFTLCLFLAAPLSAQQGRASTVGINDVLYAFQVEKTATLDTGNTPPPYPPVLRASNLEGQVLAKFVVDTNGRADMATFQVLKSEHELFSSSLRRHLPTMRFVPAEVGKRKVRQLVEMPFTFSPGK